MFAWHQMWDQLSIIYQGYRCATRIFMIVKVQYEEIIIIINNRKRYATLWSSSIWSCLTLPKPVATIVALPEYRFRFAATIFNLNNWPVPDSVTSIAVNFHLLILLGSGYSQLYHWKSTWCLLHRYRTLQAPTRSQLKLHVNCWRYSDTVRPLRLVMLYV